jgi:uncharacterized LabA/DUF88 family protein
VRTIVFVDGFNLYHSLDGVPEYHKYKWLNIKGLAQSFLTRSHEIIQVMYFTALATWHPDRGKVERHKKLIEVYRDMEIRVVEGVFRETQRKCGVCQQTYVSHEEKRTDVNIAVSMVDLAYKDAYDVACLISGDSDLIPAIRMVRDNFPVKSVRLIIPIGRKADELKRACGGDHFASQITQRHLAGNQLPDPYETVLFDKGRLINRPYSWQ